MSSINFGNVYLLLIAIPIALLVIVPFAIAVRKGNRNGHNIASLFLHLIMAAIIAFAVAGTSILTVVTQTQVYVVADVSYSVNGNLDVVDEYIKTVQENLPVNSQMSVICFGKDFEVLTEMGEKLTSVKNSDVDQSETNVAPALEYVQRQFKNVDGVIKHVVLITDGRQSDTRDENAMKRAVDALTDDGVRVSAMYIDSNLKDNAKEVQISNPVYTKSAYLGHDETVTVQISSKIKTDAKVYLYKYPYVDGKPVKNDVYVQVKDVQLPLAKGTTSFSLDTDEAGTFEYEVRVVAANDTSEYNNSCFFTQTVTSAVNVMFIANTQKEADMAKELYGESTVLTTYVLEKNRNIPYVVEDLCNFDEIVLCNADVTKFSQPASFVESLDIVVGQFGKSLVTIGDLGIQNKREDPVEAEVLERLDRMLPVNYGNNSTGKLYTIVIDTSLSMGKLEKMDRAKSAAKSVLDFLDDEDYVSIVAFNGDITYMQKPTKANSREKIKEDIENLDLHNGSLMGLGLNEAYKQFLSYDYAEKYLLFISDGLEFSSGTEQAEEFDPKALATNLRAEGIPVSVLDVGRGATSPGAANQDEFSAAVSLLKAIANNGGGKYYLVESDDLLKDNVFGGLASEINKTVINSNSGIIVNKQFDETVNGIDFSVDSAGRNVYIASYLTSSTKSRATDVLSVSYKSGGINTTTALYSRWNYGSGGGRVASFSSSIEGQWVRGFVTDANKEMYTQFFTNLVAGNIPDEKNDNPYTLKVQPFGNYARVELTPAALRANAVAEIKVTLPDGTELQDSLNISNTTYYYEFVTSQAGTYSINVNYSYDGHEYPVENFYTISYLPEYDSFVSFDVSSLRRAVGNGNVTTDGSIEIVNDENEVETYLRSLVPELLTACAALFVIDIIIRKLKWQDIKSLFKRVK